MKEYASLFIIDDDLQVCDLLQDFLQKHGYEVTTAHNGEALEKTLHSKHFDLLIIDIMLPGEDGLSICRKVRESSEIPIIILSALGEDVDRIVGLEVGADDYLAKPFNPRELLARIKALLRRTKYTTTKQTLTPAKIHFSHWILDQQQHYLIAKDGLKIPLSKSEFELLLVFIEHAGRILNRDQLLDLTKGREYLAFDRSIDVQVGRLRKKLEPDLKEPEIIKTIRNIGYQFTPNVTYQTA